MGSPILDFIKIILVNKYVIKSIKATDPVTKFAHQLLDLSKLMSSDSPCNFYSRVTRMCDMSDISRMTNNTAYISLLPLEFPLKSLDLYRISPNIPQTLCHPSKGEIVPDSSNIYFYILVVSRFYYMVHYMNSCPVLFFRLSESQG